MLAKRPNVIISIPTDPVATADAYRAAAAQGTKLVFVENIPDGFVAGRDYVSVVATDDYGNGVASAHPGPARTTLGLQWRLGASYEDVKAAVNRFVPPKSTVVFGVFEGDALWATLVLGFDADRRANVVTTVDLSELSASSGRQAIARDVVEWTKRKYPPCSLGLFMDLDSAKALLSSPDKLASLRDIAAKGNLLADPIPEVLAQSLAS